MSVQSSPYVLKPYSPEYIEEINEVDEEAFGSRDETIFEGAEGFLFLFQGLVVSYWSQHHTHTPYTARSPPARATPRTWTLTAPRSWPSCRRARPTYCSEPRRNARKKRSIRMACLTLLALFVRAAGPHPSKPAAGVGVRGQTSSRSACNFPGLFALVCPCGGALPPHPRACSGL
jgi:hypothetical protein